ncbi:MAG: ATP-binding protein [Gammaproteobacteria bacterium]|nr:ATP-binding protein [Gammaproteobacteria bacterium]MBU1481847.1 ATP-binding protein [Gammaproteobacteria bacterium]
MTYSSEEVKLRALLIGKKLEPYIRHIRFPRYKNLTPNTRVDFTYPITAFVGQNGTNKSSVIRALFGSPGQNNLGNYWFSTSIDPIKETGDERNCFIYGYWNVHAEKTVEVLKTRIHKENDPDYWEPSRPVLKYEMEEMPPLPEGITPQGRSKTRWNTIEKNVVYLDFRADLSAYDKLFYHGELRNKQNSVKSKKEFIRSRSHHLQYAIQSKSSSFLYYGERIVAKENRLLSADELLAISTILGRSYAEISLIRHTFFNCDAYTALMKTADLNYSEAFAGSGEFAVVRLVVGVMSSPESSLILLDEPEVSLHPGAQERLMEFLATMVKFKKHQIVISTHSPAIVRHLPQDAIKVFVLGPDGKIGVPSQKALPEEAFFHIGEPVKGKITVLVEDALAREIVLRAVRLTGDAISNMFEILFFPAGSQTLWGHYVPVYSAENRTDILVLFDGDKKLKVEIPDPDSIPKTDEASLKQLIFEITGVNINFKVDGGDGGTNVAQLIKMQRDFLRWSKLNVSYLPGTSIPETFVWENMEKNTLTTSVEGHANYKERFKMLTQKELGLADHEKVDAKDILSTQRRKLATIPGDHPELVRLRDRLLAAISLHNK